MLFVARLRAYAVRRSSHEAADVPRIAVSTRRMPNMIGLLFFHKTVANSLPFVSSRANSRHSTCCIDVIVPLLISGACLTCSFSSISTITPEILRSRRQTFCRVSALATHWMSPALSFSGRTSKRTTRRCRLAASGSERNKELTSVNCEPCQSILRVRTRSDDTDHLCASLVQAQILPGLEQEAIVSAVAAFHRDLSRPLLRRKYFHCLMDE